jgi:hypothetical protein
MPLFSLLLFALLLRHGKVALVISISDLHRHKTALSFTSAITATTTNNMNDNQNYFVQSGKTTSRVLAQPGGQCSIMIGGWTPEELERQRKATEQKETAKVVEQRE